MTLRPCLVCGAPAARTRCASCERARPGKWVAPAGWARLRREVFQIKGKNCFWCGGFATSVDHVVPRALGGSDELDNLVPSCATCNGRRSAEQTNRKVSPQDVRDPAS